MGPWEASLGLGRLSYALRGFDGDSKGLDGDSGGSDGSLVSEAPAKPSSYLMRRLRPHYCIS